MAIDKLNHYAIETPVVSVFDEESLTALELAGRMARKLNEVIAAQNHLDETTAQRIKEMEGEITQTLATMPSTAMAACNQLIENGRFDEAINLYLGDLKGRLDNLYNNVAPGTTTYDAEIIDARLIAEGTNPQNLGVSLRTLRNLYETEQDYIPGAILYNSEAVTNADAVVTEVETGLDVNGNKLLEMDLINGTIAAWAACMGTSGTPLSGKTARITVVNRGSSPACVNVIASNIAHWGNSMKILKSGMILGVGEVQSFDYQFQEGATEHFVTLRLSTGGFEGKKLLAFGVRVLKTETNIRKPLPIAHMTASNVTYDNFNVVATENGQRITKAMHNNTDAKWLYSVVSYKLGTIGELRNKSILLNVEKSRDIRYQGLSLKANAWNQFIELTGDGKTPIVMGDYCEQFVSDFSADETTEVFYLLGDQCLMTESVWPELTLDVCVLLLETGFRAADVLTPRAVDAVKEISKNILLTEGEKYTPNIVCWGDSLTAQGGWTDVLSQRSGLPVVNAGVGGERTSEIMARQGSRHMYISAGKPIPGNATSKLTINQYINGIAVENTPGWPITKNRYIEQANILAQGEGFVNPVWVNKIPCIIEKNGTVWTIRREYSGSDIEINRQTPIITAGERNHNNPYLMIVFMGQNNGVNGTDPDFMIPRLKAMRARAKAKHFLVLGLASGDSNNRESYDVPMWQEFGQNYISLRMYLVHNGLADAGLTATEEDTEAIAEERVPPQLFTDGVHFTDACKTVIGEMIYRHCCDIGIF